jgi:hypothetical protein
MRALLLPLSFRAKPRNLQFPSLVSNAYGGNRFVHLSEAQSTNDLQVTLTRGGRIVGQMLDEDGRPPKQGLLTLLRQGEQNGRSGIPQRFW